MSHLAGVDEAPEESPLGLPGQVHPTAMRYLPLLLTLSACATTQKEVAPIQAIDPSIEVIPSFDFEPRAWETAGSTLQASLVLAQPFDTENEVELGFRYIGPGTVELPETIHCLSLSEALALEFQSSPGLEGEGRIEVLYTSQTQGVVVAGSMPVLHKTKLIEGVDFTQLDPREFDGSYEAVFAVTVHLSPPQGELASAIHAARQVDFQTSVEQQISFAPEIKVDFHPNPQLYPEHGRSANKMNALVMVKQRSFAPIRRPFVKVDVQIGGDRAVEYLPLEF